MKKCFFLSLMTAIALLATGCGNSPAPDKEYVIVVHGGAGEMGDQADNPEIAGRYYAAIDTALNIGRSVLDAGGNGTEAVKAVIRYFESNPLFNAGVGATISAEGYFELDAAIMEGRDLSAPPKVTSSWMPQSWKAGTSVPERWRECATLSIPLTPHTP